MKGMIKMRSNLNKIIESSRGIERINLDDHLLSERKIFLEEISALKTALTSSRRLC